jgi:outer membrane protein OmpA-like peptidoglycan-associated protein
MKPLISLILIIGVALTLACSTKYTAGSEYQYQYKKEPYSVLAGKVMSADDHLPVPARVSFPGTFIHAVNCDRYGVFVATIPPGTYLVKLDAEGYMTETIPVVLAAGKSQRFDFVLRPYWDADDDWNCGYDSHPWNVVYFDPGSAVINDENLQKLDRAAEMIKIYAPAMVAVRGYTDAVGDEFSNFFLSQRRADAVKDYLVQSGLDADRLVTVGCGENNSGFDNRTHMGKIMNRRVELLPLNH